MELAPSLITLGVLFVVGLAADQIGSRTRLPRVTLLLACGIVAGEGGLGLIPPFVKDWYEFLSITALTMVAFLLGGSLTRDNLSKRGRSILAISVSIVMATILFVSLGLWLWGLNPGLALLLGAIATATAPAATQDAIRQSGKDNAFTQTLKGIVAVDDIWGLVAFSGVLITAHQMAGNGDVGILSGVVQELGGSILLGCVIGFPAAFLTGRVSDGEPLQIEALALVFLTAGLSMWLDLSYLISGMTAGMIIVNRASHHTRAFHEIEHIQWPFMILFFILAGASLEVVSLAQVGWIGAAYMVLRTLSRILGRWIGAVIGAAPADERKYYGIALLPQAGVAIGMALVAAKQFPQWSELILALSIGTTVAFELVGPAATLWAVRKVSARS